MGNNTEWKYKKNTGLYVQCGDYFIQSKMLELGSKDGTVTDPIPKKENQDHLALFFFNMLNVGEQLHVRQII